MSRILLPTPDAPPRRGGVARYIAALLRSRSDVVLDVLPDRLGTVGVFVHLARYLWGNRDISEIWTHHVLPVGTACFLLRVFGSLGVPAPSYTVFLHGLDFDLARRTFWKRWLAQRVLRSARCIVVNSRALQLEVAEFVQRDDVRVLCPCVSQDLVDASQGTRKGLVHRTPEELAKLFASAVVSATGVGMSVSHAQDAHAPVRLLTVARLVARKGHEKVLRALARLPQVTYSIVGDGPELQRLRLVAEEEGVSDRVHFLTTVSDEDLPALYVAHDIFVMPTTKHAYDREGFGIAYAEAGLFGLPSVATNIAGVNEVIDDGVTGMLIEDTHDALFDALTRLAGSSGLRSRMGSAARLRVLAHFTEERFSERLRAIFGK